MIPCKSEQGSIVAWSKPGCPKDPQADKPVEAVRDQHGQIKIDAITKMCISSIANMTVDAVIAHHRRTGLTESVVVAAKNLKIKVENIAGGFKVTKL